jgi:hypothetical protein
MTPMIGSDAVDTRAAVLLVLLLSWLGSAHAQGDAAIPESVLRAPWEQHLRVLESMPVQTAAEGRRALALADSLAALQVSLGEFEVQVDQLVDRVIGDPQYAYVAAETSSALAAQLTDVHARFEAVYTELGAREREDVRSAQAALTALRSVLEGKTAFERDMLRALGSGSRQQIVELATRWWNGEERAIAVRKRVASMRQTLEGLPGNERGN